MAVLVVFSTFPSPDKAAEVARILVSEQLCACVNLVGPVRSIYRWQGAVQTAEETAAIFKTTHDSADALVTRIAGLHSYEVPCIVTWPIDKIIGSYAQWVADSVG